MATGSSDDNHESAEALKDDTASKMKGQQQVHVLRSAEGGSSSRVEHFKAKIRHVCRKICCLGSSFTDPVAVDSGINVDNDKHQQFRLETSHNGLDHWFYFLSCGFLGKKPRRNGQMDIGVNPNQQLAMYLHWMFRVNFLFLFCVMCVMFFVLVMVFAALIIVAGTIDAQCVRVGGSYFGEVGSEFADAFALSWTTFSTVGYGSSYPAVGFENDSPTNCFFITFICSLESLLGVLYSGFCGAILFGKVLRIQSHAQVIFSDPIVIRYGRGVAEGPDDDHSNDQGAREGPKSLPCPVLEFRIVNRLFNEAGGEIMDATLNVVANVDANDADPSFIDALDSNHKGHNPTLSGGTNHSDEGTASGFGSDHPLGYGPQGGHDSLAKHNFHSSTHAFPKFLDPFHSLFPGKLDHPAGDEDPSEMV